MFAVTDTGKVLLQKLLFPLPIRRDQTYTGHLICDLIWKNIRTYMNIYTKSNTLSLLSLSLSLEKL